MMFTFLTPKLRKVDKMRVDKTLKELDKTNIECKKALQSIKYAQHPPKPIEIST